jgi:S1-C subfamily serine protease
MGLICACVVLTPSPRARADAGGAELREAERSVVRVLAVHMNADNQVVALVGGTGFVIAPGKIVTNNHVIAPPDGVSRTVYYVVPDRFAGDAGKAAEVLHAWPGSDLALLSAPDITAPRLAVAAAPPGKEAVVRAMGYPGVTDEMRGLPLKDKLRPSEPYVTSGSIALFSDTAPGGAKEDTIFHTAPIDHGNSGGPLLDSCGRLIGINTWSAAGAVSSDGSVESHPGQYAAISASVLTRLLSGVGVEPQVESAPCVLGAVQVAAAPGAGSPVDAPKPAVRHGDGGWVWIVAAIVLLGGGAAVVIYLQRQTSAFSAAQFGSPSPLGPTAFLVVAVGLVGVIGLVYFMKPAAKPAVAQTASVQSARPKSGLACEFAADQSFNPLPQAPTLNMSFDPALGCLNGRSAYAKVDGRYVRLSINEKDHLVSRLELSGDLKTFTRRDYALSESDLETLGNERQAFSPPSCPTSANPLTSTEATDFAGQVRSTLSSTIFSGEPTRVMTWRCAPPAASGAGGPASTALDDR